jgi:hypothetical protein
LILKTLKIWMMINNSSLQKWDRLKQKQLDTMFVNTLIQGMSCSNFEAMAILNQVYEIYQPFFDNSATMKSGQVLFEVVSVDNSPKLQLSECKLVRVILTIDGGEEDLVIREQEGVIGLRRHRVERITNEAFQQGGVLTVEDISNCLLNCGERTVCRDIAYFKGLDIILPLRSTIKDMGKSISHRVLIVKQWLQGKDFSEIARNTNHTVRSVANYVDKFKRIICLAKDNYEINAISFFVKLSPSLTKQYYQLYATVKIAPHRELELNELLKKRE